MVTLKKTSIEETKQRVRYLVDGSFFKFQGNIYQRLFFEVDASYKCFKIPDMKIVEFNRDEFVCPVDVQIVVKGYTNQG
nr:MAG TPA: hypothetical protein [Caudoviricetes sp.]